MNSQMARAVLRPWRHRQLQAALTNGLPQVLEAPLRFLFTGELEGEDQQRVERVERLRSEIATSGAMVNTVLGDDQTTIRRLALTASVDRRFGTFLYLCAKATGSQTILELGSCVGVGTAYMASAGCERIVSADGEPVRAEIARHTVQQVKPDAEIVVGFFDDVLGDIVASLTQGVDLAWIDGHHQKDPTLHYFDRIKPVLNPGAVVVFDDIRWSDDMRHAWDILKRARGLSDAIDLKDVGIGIWRGDSAIPHLHDLRGLYGRPTG